MVGERASGGNEGPEPPGANIPLAGTDANRRLRQIRQSGPGGRGRWGRQGIPSLEQNWIAKTTAPLARRGDRGRERLGDQDRLV